MDSQATMDLPERFQSGAEPSSVYTRSVASQDTYATG
jgi:hypothetical protein